MDVACSKVLRWMVVAATPKRRWLQFRVATLLLAVTGIAVACGVLKRKMVSKGRERAAVAEIKRLDGLVFYNWENMFDPNRRVPGPAWLRKALGDDFFAKVMWVQLGQADITDDWLVHLEPLDKLRIWSSISSRFHSSWGMA